MGGASRVSEGSIVGGKMEKFPARRELAGNFSKIGRFPVLTVTKTSAKSAICEMRRLKFPTRGAGKFFATAGNLLRVQVGSRESRRQSIRSPR
jgi:hypothetical protein